MEFISINTLSLLDYPEKVAAILYVQPCNFRCPFCHNWKTLITNHEMEAIPFEEILSFLRKRIGILDGVVISGGEPTLMPDLKEKIIEIKKLGYLVKLDTNGTNPEMLEDLVNSKLVDYVAMDVKNSLFNYENVSGVKPDTTKLLRSIEFLKQNKVDYEFRMTLINEFHNVEDIREIASLLKGSKKFYLQKFMDSDGVENKNLHHVDEGLANKYREILSKDIELVELRGY